MTSPPGEGQFPSRRAARPAPGLAPSVALVGFASIAVAFRGPIGIDYDNDAQPAINALRDGRLNEFFSSQPLMGMFSLLIRAPFAAVADLVDGDDLLAYRLGVLPCLAAAGFLGVFLWRRMSERGAPLYAGAAVAGLFVFNPLVFFSLQAGHPEEVLGAALAVGAVVAAAERRTLLAALLCGFAVTTKQWAVIAVVPVLLATPPHERKRLMVAGGVLAAAITVPAALADFGRFVHIQHLALHTGSITLPFSVWWPFGERIHPGLGVGLLPSGLSYVTHPLIVLLGVPLGLLYWRRGKTRPPEDALLLLSLLFLLRCVLDPTDNGYYHVPFLFSLAAYEGLCRRGLPVLALLAATALWLNIDLVWSKGHFDAANAAYLAWVLPALSYLALLTFRAAGSRELVQGPRPSLPEGLLRRIPGASP